MKKVLTLSFIQHQGRLLLGMKKRGFGAGRWNGFGGKVEPGESIEAAARREVVEEVGVVVEEMEVCGELTFTFESSEDVLVVHVYRITAWQGEPIETEEMQPQWFEEGAIPYEQMWSDDIFWLPYLLRGGYFVGSFHFDQPATAEHPAIVLSHQLHVQPGQE